MFHGIRIVRLALSYRSETTHGPDHSSGIGLHVDDNKVGNEDEDEVEMQDEDDDEEGEEFELDDNDDKEEDDDDDESWKVRRSAIRALKAVAEAKKHDPSTLWNLLYKVRRGKTAIFASALVARFMEREENRRVDVIDGFTRLLTVTIKARLPFKFRTFICSRCCHG